MLIFLQILTGKNYEFPESFQHESRIKIPHVIYSGSCQTFEPEKGGINDRGKPGLEQVFGVSACRCFY